MTDFECGEVKSYERLVDWLWHQLERRESMKHDPSISEAMRAAATLRLALRAINAGTE
jgi:hypothetical protein